MKIKKFPILILTIFIILITSLYSNNDNIKVTSSLSRDKIKIGDKFNFQIVLEYKPDILIEKLYLINLEENKDAIEIKNQEITPPNKKNFLSKNIIQKFSYDLAGYKTGKYTFPPIKVEYKIKNSTYSIESKELTLTIESIISKKDLKNIEKTKKIDIKDIKNDVLILSTFQYILIIILILGIIGFIIWFYFFRKHKISQQQKLPADVIALLDLENLRKSNLKQTNIKEFYVILSEIFKKYLENRYKIDILEKTTNEIFYTLKQKTGFSRENLLEIKNFLDDSDLVKFAKFIPDENLINQHFDFVVNFVEITKIKIEDSH